MRLLVLIVIALFNLPLAIDAFCPAHVSARPLSSIENDFEQRTLTEYKTNPHPSTQSIKISSSPINNKIHKINSPSHEQYVHPYVLETDSSFFTEALLYAISGLLEEGYLDIGWCCDCTGLDMLSKKDLPLLLPDAAKGKTYPRFCWKKNIHVLDKQRNKRYDVTLNL